MISSVYIAGKQVRLNPNQAIGKGGEADIYRIANKAIKIYKTPDHPDFVGQPAEQQGAANRIKEHQQKLPAFPKHLPPRVVVPETLVYDKPNGQIVGYTMSVLDNTELLLRYSERSFRQSIDNNTVVSIYSDLHPTITGLHAANVVLGDFNDLNVLIKDTEAYLIDADSFQFGKFYCHVFTARFVDPLLCNPNAANLLLTKPHTQNSDWYAFAVMLMQSLLFVDPYGGVYLPKNPADRVNHNMRPLKRITVFNPEVKYPKPAIPYQVLPDDLLQYFHLVFEKDQRGEFPLKLLQNLRWTICSQCGAEHARGICPNCATAAPAAVHQVTTIRGNVIATRIFSTRGHILYACMQGGRMRWLSHGSNKFSREDGTVIIEGSIDPMFRYRISGNQTLVARGNRLITFSPQGQMQQVIDTYGNLPMFDANETSRYWLENGQLKRDGDYSPRTIGNVLPGQTIFWVGPTFGFGFYRAGDLAVVFVFDAASPGLNDSVKLPPIRGQLIDATCTFTEQYCWLFVSSRVAGENINTCHLINRRGEVLATSEAKDGDGSWLGTTRGKGAIGSFLFAPTDDGIVRLEAQNGSINITREFPDTEPYVSTASSLFIGTDGIYTVNGKEIYRLKIA